MIDYKKFYENIFKTISDNYGVLLNEEILSASFENNSANCVKKINAEIV